MSTDIKNFIFTESYIDGKWVASGSHRKFKVINPSTLETITEVNDGGSAHVKSAISAANKAFPAWKEMIAKDRSYIMEKWWRLILKKKETIATIMSMESGKPIKESRAEVDYAASFVKWFAEEGQRANGSVIPTFDKNKRVVAIKQPIGVVGAITPWNFPAAMITRKISPALACGCTVIVRPSNKTPLTALLLAQLAHEAGFPPGVLNVVIGEDSSEMGKILCESEIVRKISFTGSTQVGASLMKQSAPTIKKLSLELGGNAPFIVFDDADLEAAAAGAIASKYRNSGQTCVCVNRILVQNNVYKEFLKIYSEKVKQLKLGDGLEEDTDIGPLINKKAIKKINDLMEDATKKGAKVFYSGESIGEQFMAPVVLSDATRNMKIFDEEIFGPVSAFYKFSTEEEAIEMANDTIFGLASYFYSNDIGRCWRVSEALEYGMVGVNEGAISTAVAPFGGVKASGLGREGSHYGIDDYLEIKYMCFGNINSST